MEWLRPQNIDEALNMVSGAGPNSVIVAGGTFLGVTMANGLLAPDSAISLSGLTELRQVHVDDAGVVLPALVTHAEVASDRAIGSALPSVASAFKVVASRRIRNQATVGGVLGDADYASDPPSMLVALRAEAWCQSATSMRSVPVQDLIQGHYTTDLEHDELITHVSIPRIWSRSGYWKFKSRSSEDRPCVGVAAAERIYRGQTRELRVVLGAVHERPVFYGDICDQALSLPREDWAEFISEEYLKRFEPLDDVRGSTTYRTRIIGVGVRRALEGMVDHDR